jgi:hypothetical protein
LIICMRKVPLSWENRACRESCPPTLKGTFHVQPTGRRPKITVSSDGKGIVGQAGGLLLMETLRVTGLDQGLSRALERWRPPRAVHDPGKIMCDLAVMLALGPVGSSDHGRAGRLRSQMMDPQVEPGHGAVGCLVIAGGQPSAFLELVDAAFDGVVLI